MDTYKLILSGIKWLDKNAKKGFSYLSGINRSINPAQVTKLAESVNKMGILRCVVVAKISFITGKPTWYIIDGQHLFNALIRNNMDIPYIVIDITDKKHLVETIALLNASSKNWCLADYITAWGSMLPDYVRLNHYFQVYDIEISALASILSDGTGGSGSIISKKIKTGTFKIVNEKENVQVLDYLTDVLKIVPRMNRFENKYLCSEYVSFLRSARKYEHDKFLNFLSLNKKQLVLATQEVGKLGEMFKKSLVK